MRVFNDTITIGTDLASNQTSDAYSVEHIANFAVQFALTGSPSGTIKVQASLDAESWSDVPSASTSVAASGVFFINVVDAGYNYMRVVYERTTGTGTITKALINGKGF